MKSGYFYVLVHPSDLNFNTGGGMRALLSLGRLIETILLIAMKLVVIFFAAIVAFIAALTWKK